MRRRLLITGLAVTAAVAATTGPAGARERVVTLRGYDAPGPARYDTVRVLQMGPRTARHVLLLEPGTSAGAPYFQVVARDIVARLPGWQVWAIDRRENLLEDHSVLDRAKRGKATPREVFDYYLGWITDSSVTNHFQPIPDASVAFAKG